MGANQKSYARKPVEYAVNKHKRKNFKKNKKIAY